MRYETFLFTRNQRQDFTAFVRPSRLTNKDVSAIGGIFNYVSDISRLTSDFPSLYYFPLGEYILLLRHYNSGRTHAGRAIGNIEGIAVQSAYKSDLSKAIAQFVDQQATLLNIAATIDDIEAQSTIVSTEQEWTGQALHPSDTTIVAEFLRRRAQDRLFLPFTESGRNLLTSALADRRFAAPPFFAYGTNSDVLTQLEHQGTIDIVSFFKTERPSYRNRQTNRVSGQIDTDETLPDPSSLTLRPISADEMHLRPPTPLTDELDDDTKSGIDAVSIRAFKSAKTENAPITSEPDDDNSTMLTMRQMRDKIRADEAAAQPEPVNHDPIHWLLKLFSSLLSPNKPK